MFFSFITKNLNWEILTKNLNTLKRWEGVKDEKFEYYELSLKNPIFRKGSWKANIKGGDILKRGLGQLQFKSGLSEKEGVFLREGG